MGYGLSNTTFWSPTAGWDASGTFNYSLSSTDETAILGWIDILEGSTSAASVIRAEVSAAGSLRIGGHAGGEPGKSFTNPSQPGHYYAFDIPSIGDFRYINDHGKAVGELGVLTVAHEFYHNLDDDPHTAGNPLVAPTDAEMNAADFDFKGEVVKHQNVVAGELDLNDNIQAAYGASWMMTDAPDLPAPPDANGYTEGNHIDNARFGSSGANLIDHSNSVTTIDDLIFGFEGKDSIDSGVGRDYIYGGKGDDDVFSEGAFSRLEGNEGNEGNDTLMGLGSEDTYVGGLGDDLIKGFGQDPHR